MQGDPAEQAVEVPEVARELFTSLLAEAPRPPETLRQEVADHLEVVAGSPEEWAVDRDLATAIAKSLSGLIDALGSDPDPQHHRLVQAACHYFVSDEDAENDLSSIVGFDDDAAVMNAVAAHLGRQDLTIGG